MLDPTIAFDQQSVCRTSIIFTAKDWDRFDAVPHNSESGFFGRADVVHIGTPRQQVSRDSVVNALHQDLGPSSVGNTRDPIGSTVVDSGQQANRFSPLTAEIEEEPLSGFRPTVAESDTDTLENPSIFGESEVHEDHVARDVCHCGD